MDTIEKSKLRNFLIKYKGENGTLRSYFVEHNYIPSISDFSLNGIDYKNEVKGFLFDNFEFANVNFNKLNFLDSQWDLVSLRKVLFNKVIFSRSEKSQESISFASARLEDVSFVETDLEFVVFDYATLETVDFSRAAKLKNQSLLRADIKYTTYETTEKSIAAYKCSRTNLDIIYGCLAAQEKKLYEDYKKLKEQHDISSIISKIESRNGGVQDIGPRGGVSTSNTRIGGNMIVTNTTTINNIDTNKPIQERNDTERTNSSTITTAAPKVLGNDQFVQSRALLSRLAYEREQRSGKQREQQHTNACSSTTPKSVVSTPSTLGVRIEHSDIRQDAEVLSTGGSVTIANSNIGGNAVALSIAPNTPASQINTLDQLSKSTQNSTQSLPPSIHIHDAANAVGGQAENNLSGIRSTFS